MSASAGSGGGGGGDGTRARQMSHSVGGGSTVAPISANGATAQHRSRLLTGSELAHLTVSRGYEHATALFILVLSLCMINAIIYSTSPPFHHATDDNNEAAIGGFSIAVVTPVFYFFLIAFRRSFSEYREATERVRVAALKRATIASPQLGAAKPSTTPDRVAQTQRLRLCRPLRWR
jgi:hypothetical protein